MKPLIFLDVDGVLNHFGSSWRGAWPHVLDAACVARVKRLIEVSGADVVLSSTWRLDARGGALDALRAAGLSWIASTPILGGQPRRDEIYLALQTLDMHGTRPVIVIDDGLDASLAGHDRFRNRGQRRHLFVRTSMHTGLTDELVDGALAWLARIGEVAA